ncbi:MAG: DUF6498-containing protein [Opitutaceae bacterium]
MRDETASPPPGRWAQAWPDALAFGAGLALAWFGDWQTKDLVWSLWLSSLLVGYAMIVWDIFGTRALGSPGFVPPTIGMARAAVLFGQIFLLAFFTVHFGMFHFVHGTFLNGFFPLEPGWHGVPGPRLFVHVLADYWPFVLVAAVAERKAFRRKVTLPGTDGMIGPYKNVIRLHLLIFFFAFTSFMRLQNFAIYAVVYAVYFFPWRLIKGPEAISGKL